MNTWNNEVEFNCEVWNVAQKTIFFYGFLAAGKGQIMSECIYEIIDFTKYHQNFLIDFCPGRFYRLGQGGASEAVLD